MNKKAGVYSQIDSFDSFDELFGEVNGIWKHHYCRCEVKVEDKKYHAKILEYDPKFLFGTSVNDKEYLLTILEVKNNIEDHKNVSFQKFNYLSWEECNKAATEYFDGLNVKYFKSKWNHKIYLTKPEGG